MGQVAWEAGSPTGQTVLGQDGGEGSQAGQGLLGHSRAGLHFLADCRACSTPTGQPRHPTSQMRPVSQLGGALSASGAFTGASHLAPPGQEDKPPPTLGGGQAPEQGCREGELTFVLPLLLLP